MLTRGITINVSTELVTEQCCNCHVLFAMPVELRQVLIDKPGPNGRSFYCPNGHSQWYIDETEAQRLRRELEVAQRRLAATRAREQQLANDNMDLAKSNRALKGAKTKLLRRVTNGICPCCQRSFANMQRHMTTKHPGEVVSAAATGSS